MREYALNGQLQGLSVQASIPGLTIADDAICADATFTPNTNLALGIFQDYRWGKVFYHTVASYEDLEGWQTLGEE